MPRSRSGQDGARRRARIGRLGRPRQMFLTGLVIILPLFVSLWLLDVLFGMVHGLSTPIILRTLRILRAPLVDDPAFTTYVAPLIGVLATLALIFLVGALATNLLGRRLVERFDRAMLRIPLVKPIYGGTRQLLDAFSRKNDTFQRVVAVEYPRPGVYQIGFVTRDNVSLGRAGKGPILDGFTLVFLPTTPNPTSGWLAAVPESQVVPLEVTIEEGVKLIVSGGLVVPPGWNP